MTKINVQDVIAEATNRRRFVGKLGLASAAVGALTVGGQEAQGQSAHPNDIDILNFALNLEYLEAEFYTVATTGKRISDPPFNLGIWGQGKEGATYGGHQVYFDNDSVFTRDVALELGYDEREHVTLLRSALGNYAVAKPAIDLDALGFGFDSQADFLKLARIFEDIGVTAYAGAAPLISSKAYLATAARILATEAEHVGNIRLQIAKLNIPTAPRLDGVDHLPPPSGRKFFSVNQQALTGVRTPQQVLYLAYGDKPNATSGGFFPWGANGYFHQSSTAA